MLNSWSGVNQGHWK